MTLATIVLFSIFYTPPVMPRLTNAQEPAPQSVPASKPAESTATQDQGSTPSTQNPPAPSEPTSPSPPAETPSSTTPSSTPAITKPSGQTSSQPVKKPRHKKRVLPANCVSASAATGQPAAGSTPAPGDTTGTSSTPTPAGASAQTNCPPPKVVVRQGGTTEPSIQLAGGAGGTSHQRDTTNQLLGSTEANLKTIAGRQLSANQKDMVNQIRQFMKQSKAAVDEGDLERARTLAWKAQVLSQELVKPSP